MLFSTDVAARGLDIPGVDWILHFDCPTDTDDYVHRSGRTARMGQAGYTTIFVSPHEVGAAAGKRTTPAVRAWSNGQHQVLGGASVQMGYIERLRGLGVTFTATDVATLLRALPPPVADSGMGIPKRLKKELESDGMEAWQRAATHLQLRVEAHLLTSPVVHTYADGRSVRAAWS